MSTIKEEIKWVEDIRELDGYEVRLGGETSPINNVLKILADRTQWLDDALTNASTSDVYGSTSPGWTPMSYTLSVARSKITTCAGPDGSVYASGGVLDTGNTGIIERIDPYLGTVSTIATLPPHEYLPMTYDKVANKIMFANYIRQGGAVIQAAGYIDPVTGQITNISAPGTIAGSGTLFTGFDGDIYYHGGRDSSLTYYSDVFRYDRLTDTWTNAFDNNLKFIAAATIPTEDGNIFIMGGIFNGVLDPAVYRSSSSFTPALAISNYLFNAVNTINPGHERVDAALLGPDVVYGFNESNLVEYRHATDSYRDLGPSPLGAFNGALEVTTRGRVMVIGGRSSPGGSVTDAIQIYTPV